MPFPVQPTSSKSPWGCQPAGEIPDWLAEEVYKRYVARGGKCQSLERIRERGGFFRDEILGLLEANHAK